MEITFCENTCPYRKSHFTILNIYYTITNAAIKMRYMGKERENLEAL